MSSTSTILNRYPGVMKMSVSPAKGRRRPSSAAAASSSLSTVLPTATTRPLAALPASAVDAGTSPDSGCIRWSSVSATRTGRKVPAPTCRVRNAVSTPRASRAAIRPGVKCRAAVGAATAPSFSANMVW